MQYISVLCVGLSLCLSAHTSSDSTLSTALSFVNPIASGGSANAALTGSPPSPIKPEAVRAVSQYGGAANTQKQANAAGVDRTHFRFSQPVEGFPITSTFGNRIHPLFGDVRFHNGIDLGTPNGTPVKASGKGLVAFADWDGGYGKTIIIQHEHGYETLYAHLDDLLVSVGDRVTQGEVIGLSGSTGYVTGPHLHFEIQVNQVAHNPLDYL